MLATVLVGHSDYCLQSLTCLCEVISFVWELAQHLFVERIVVLAWMCEDTWYCRKTQTWNRGGVNLICKNIVKFHVPNNAVGLYGKVQMFFFCMYICIIVCIVFTVLHFLFVWISKHDHCNVWVQMMSYENMSHSLVFSSKFVNVKSLTVGYVPHRSGMYLFCFELV